MKVDCQLFFRLGSQKSVTAKPYVNNRNHTFARCGAAIKRSAALGALDLLKALQKRGVRQRLRRQRNQR